MKQFIKCLLILLLSFGAVERGLAQKQGQALIDSFLQELPKAKNDTNKVSMLHQLSYAFGAINPDEGIKYGKMGLELAKKIGWEKAIPGINESIGANYQYKNDYLNALGFYSKALDAYEKRDDKEQIAKVTLNIGQVYLVQSNYPVALSFLFKALQIYESIGNKSRIAQVNSDIGGVYMYEEDFSKSLTYFLKATEILEGLGDKSTLADIWGNMAGDYFYQNNLPKALEYSLKALQTDEELGKTQAIAMVTGSIANIYVAQKNYTKGLEYFIKGLKISEDAKDKNSMTNILGNLGNTYISIAKDTGKLVPIGEKASLAKGIEYLNKAIALCKEINDSNSLMINLSIITEAYTLSGNYKDALKSYEEAVAIKDSVFSNENSKKIMQMDMQYSFDKKAAALKAENDKQKAVTAEKTKRLQIIWAIAAGILFIGSIYWLNLYRRRKLRNTRLQLTSLARAKLHNIRSKYNNIYVLALENEHKKNSISEAQTESVLINYIDKSSTYFKALLNGWKKEQWTIADELALLQKFYESEIVIKKRVSIVKNFGDIAIEKVGFLQEVFTTLLDNSMAYAFPKVTHDCVFTISISKERNVLHFEISDNGEGADIKKYRTDDPNDGLNVLNARIINAFALAGWRVKNIPDIHISASKEKGTTIKFDFPYAEVKNTDS